ncbi:MAG: hypothetical protein IT472_08720 [Thermomonas sp.]|uniref:hypothetical protein n=1 Tax=Thermomonas sp. TaxID=1971895 RepID=UPI00261AF7A4|nr:hypothetical protein [Thermomonas sp.]MCC7097247.1 hypothetical protein [Thermomonas sp.]
MKLDPLARIEELPIPQDAGPTKKWTEQMLELAAHIGPYATLLLVDRVGGQKITVPMDPARNRLRQVVGDEAAAVLSRVYGANELLIPVARAALNEARRGAVIAAIREKRLTIAEAAPILRTSTRYVSFLVNHTEEGKRDRAWEPTRIRARAPDPRQLDMFPSAG